MKAFWRAMAGQNSAKPSGQQNEAVQSRKGVVEGGKATSDWAAGVE